MQLTFWGAARTVTGSQHSLKTESGTYLLDCGLYQGRRQEAYELNSRFPFAAKSIRSVILSHAHLDHSGNLPGLVKQGFGGAIHATPATADLCRYMLADSAHLQEKDAEFILKRGARRRAIGVEDHARPTDPLYTMQDAQETVKRFATSGYGATTKLDDQLSFTFRRAGHILGSAVTLLEHSAQGRKVRLLFSGDLGRPGSAILAEREPAAPADYLILESTYGDRLHTDPVGTEATLEKLILATAQRGGHVVVPAFAVGRTQQLVLLLHNLVKRNAIPKMPIFVDSPLAVDVTKVFEQHLDELGDDAARYIKAGEDPFGFRQLRYLHEAAESKTLNGLRVPYVVVSPSGMCEGGRVLHHLQNSVEDPRNTILITGYQAVNTLGRKISERQPEIRVFGEQMTLRAQVETLNELSAHADQHELVEWVRPIAPGLKTVFLVHGEGEAQTTLARLLEQELKVKVVVPERGQSVELV